MLKTLRQDPDQFAKIAREQSDDASDRRRRVATLAG